MTEKMKTTENFKLVQKQIDIAKEEIQELERLMNDTSSNKEDNIEREKIIRKKVRIIEMALVKSIGEFWKELDRTQGDKEQSRYEDNIIERYQIEIEAGN